MSHRASAIFHITPIPSSPVRDRFSRKSSSLRPTRDGVQRTAPSRLAETVDSVECCRLIAFGQGRVVEHRVDEVVHRAAQRQHRLADVHELRRLRANDVDSQYLARLAVENQLQHSGAITEDLSARNLAVLGPADLIRDAFTSEL